MAMDDALQLHRLVSLPIILRTGRTLVTCVSANISNLQHNSVLAAGENWESHVVEYHSMQRIIESTLSQRALSHYVL